MMIESYGVGDLVVVVPDRNGCFVPFGVGVICGYAVRFPNHDDTWVCSAEEVRNISDAGPNIDTISTQDIDVLVRGMPESIRSTVARAAAYLLEKCIEQADQIEQRKKKPEDEE